MFIQRHNDTRNNVNRMLLKYSVIWPPVVWKARQRWGALCSSCSTAWLVNPTKSCTHYIFDTWNCDEQSCLYTERNFTARITNLVCKFSSYLSFCPSMADFCTLLTVLHQDVDGSSDQKQSTNLSMPLLIGAPRAACLYSASDNPLHRLAAMFALVIVP